VELLKETSGITTNECTLCKVPEFAETTKQQRNKINGIV